VESSHCSKRGTEGRTRTVTLLRAGDFESPVSTNSTTPARKMQAAEYSNYLVNGNLFVRLFNENRYTESRFDSQRPDSPGRMDLSTLREKRHGDETR
jgi:hypothetical protein